jgi:hypothetical protein
LREINSKTWKEVEIDHVFPHILKRLHNGVNIDGIWNLVITCKECNQSKSAKRANEIIIDKLFQRNNYLIDSHHPLRETLINQMGPTLEKRDEFIKKRYEEALCLPEMD